MVSLVSRQGRTFQRYNKQGSRQVVGCIPYKFNTDKSLEVLVVSSQKGHDILFPKGGWEMDEKIKEAAGREAFEEAGVEGKIENKLGKWNYKSKSQDVVHEGIMFPMSVTNELLQWPEMNARKRKWVTVAEFKERCPHVWMTQALDKLVKRLSRRQQRAMEIAAAFMGNLNRAAGISGPSLAGTNQTCCSRHSPEEEAGACSPLHCRPRKRRRTLRVES